MILTRGQRGARRSRAFRVRFNPGARSSGRMLRYATEIVSWRGL